MTSKELTERILRLPGIEALNAMQEAVAASEAAELVLLSPTGSGKTLAFVLRLLPMVEVGKGLQAVVLAPSRELVLQIAGVLKAVGAGLRIAAFYGGHQMSLETNTLAASTPDIIVATPGRLLDHIMRKTVDVAGVKALVVDEYDKALELGFEDQMKRIFKKMGRLDLLVLTSATRLESLPPYLPQTRRPGVTTLDFVEQSGKSGAVEVVEVESYERDKLTTLISLLNSFDGTAIVFVNHRESADRVYEALRKSGIDAGRYHGGMDQYAREQAVEMLANGTTPVLVATDLGSRGLDITGLDAVVHYHLPTSAEAWTHRNGRTGRQQASGTVYVITHATDDLPEYIAFDRRYQPRDDEHKRRRSETATLYLNLGRRDKVSRGDVAGYLICCGELDSSQVGHIMVSDRWALAAVPRKDVGALIARLNTQKIKGHRVKVSKLD